MQFKNNRRKPYQKLRHALSTPFIYAVIIPSVLLDIILELYHRICFPLYGLPMVSRRQYIRVDRQKLAYLTFLEKVNCMYCGYVNGLMRYASRIAQESERYWCGIMHEGKNGFVVPEYQKNFLPYGDEAAFRKFVEQPNGELPLPPDTEANK